MANPLVKALIQRVADLETQVRRLSAGRANPVRVREGVVTGSGAIQLAGDADPLPAGIRHDSQPGRAVAVVQANNRAYPLGGSGTFLNVRDFRVIGDGVTDDAAAIQSAIDAAVDAGGATVFFPPGRYRADGAVTVGGEGVSLRGSGASASVLVMDVGLRLSAGGFAAHDLGFEAAAYSTSCRAIQFTAFTGDGLAADVSGFTVSGCRFEGFFYATSFAGATYAAASNPDFTPGGYVRDITIINCTSIAPASVNAGHFQHLMCADVTVTACSTYGGAGATSFNFIGGNRQLRIASNYCDGNDYGSCEIENFSGQATVTGNVFKAMLWLDDSSDIAVAGNVVEALLRISVQTGDVRSITVTGNVLGQVSVVNFGVTQNPAVTVDDIVIANNIINGGGTWGALINDSENRIRGVDVIGNTFAGTSASGIVSVGRNADIAVRLMWNKAHASNNQIVIGGSGGSVTSLGNTGATHSGTRDRFPLTQNEMQISNGLVVLAPNGTPYRIYVDNAGDIQVAAA